MDTDTDKGREDLELNEFEPEERREDVYDGDLTQPIERVRPPQSAKELEGVYEIPVEVSAVLGHAEMPVSELLKLGRGSLVQLNRKLGEPIDIHVNNRLIARGEVVVVEDKLGISMTEIIKTDRTQGGGGGGGAAG